MRGQAYRSVSRVCTPCLALTLPLLGFVASLLAGTSKVDSKDLSNSEISPDSIVDNFVQGKVWCTSYRARDNSCTSVQRFSAKSVKGVEVTVLRGYPFKVKEIYPMNIFVENNRVCADFSQTVDRYFRYVTSNRSGELLPNDQAFRDKEMLRYREGLQKSISGLGHVCWSYSERKRTESGRVVIQVIGYRDGVKQRVDKRETGTFFEKDHNLSFRHPIYKSSK